MAEPGWYPDPSSRHQLRWFDGTRYTDQVADGGVQSSDPGPPAPVPGVTPPSDTTGRPASRLPLILAAVGALVVIVAVVTLLGGDGGGGSGAGRFEGQVDAGEEGRHEVSIPAGAVAVVTVEPDPDFDVVVGFDVARAAARRIEDLYAETPLAFAAEVEDGVVFRRDTGFEGEDEQTLLPVPFAVDAAVVVSGFGDSEGAYEITIEVIRLAVDDDADGDDLIDAVLASDDVPRDLRRDVESVLEE